MRGYWDIDTLQDGLFENESYDYHGGRNNTCFFAEWGGFLLHLPGCIGSGGCFHPMTQYLRIIIKVHITTLNLSIGVEITFIF